MVEEQIFAQPQAVRQSSALEVEIVRDIGRFNSIASDWDRLVDQSTDCVFLSHAWFRTWWESFGRRNELYVITVRSRGHLLAVAPMMRTETRIYGFKTAALHAIYNPHTPRYDFIVGSDQDPRLYQAIWTAFTAQHGCDVVVLSQVPDDSKTILAIEKLAHRQGWRTGQWIAPVAPFIRLGCNYETFFARLGAGTRFNVTKRYARLRRLGPVEVEIITERAYVNAALREGMRIEAAAWKGENGTAMMSDPRVADFYLRLACRFADLGQLRLTFLRLSGERIAFAYLLQNRKKWYAVKIGYDPRYHSYSPGNMLLNLVLKDACRRGVTEYDLLGGDDEWKFEWTTETRGHRWLFLFRNRLRSRMLHGLKFGLVPILKRRFA